jgi:protease I
MPKKVLMVIAQNVFRDEEYAHPKEVLERRYAQVVTASEHAGRAIGKKGMLADATLAVADAKPGDYDAVAFIGGAGASVFFNDPAAQKLARAMADKQKVVGAICIAPSTLARAGLLDGKRATSFPDREDDLVLHGATWTGNPVEIDGRIITANGPDAAYDFGEAIADALGI